MPGSIHILRITVTSTLKRSSRNRIYCSGNLCRWLIARFWKYRRYSLRPRSWFAALCTLCWVFFFIINREIVQGVVRETHCWGVSEEFALSRVSGGGTRLQQPFPSVHLRVFQSRHYRAASGSPILLYLLHLTSQLLTTLLRFKKQRCWRVRHGPWRVWILPNLQQQDDRPGQEKVPWSILLIY